MHRTILVTAVGSLFQTIFNRFLKVREREKLFSSELKFTFDVTVISNSKADASKISRLLPQSPTYQYSFNMKRRLQGIDLTFQANLFERDMQASHSFAFIKLRFAI